MSAACRIRPEFGNKMERFRLGVFNGCVLVYCFANLRGLLGVHLLLTPPIPAPKLMRILIAPDKFKESLTAQQVAAAIRDGFRSVFAEASFDIVPVADGGEGTAGIFLEALGGEWVEVASHDALNRPVTASYAWIGDTKLAVIEMSAASGLWRIAAGERNPTQANTFGTGELVADAIGRGARNLLIGLGGSATNDAGVGMAAALGWKFLDEEGRAVTPHPTEFRRIRRMVPPPTSLSCNVTGLCDVGNPLLGESGATRVFGPQKGVTGSMLSELEDSLAHIASLCAKQFGEDHSGVAGAGAAGGLGFGLLVFLRARLESGFQAISRLMDLEKRISSADLVITGEGRLDAQSLHGKAPFEISQLAARYRKPVIGFAGIIDDELPGFDACVPIANGPLTLDESRRRAAELLRAAATRTARLLRITL
jgi:glycerate 2-kinase